MAQQGITDWTEAVKTFNNHAKPWPAQDGISTVVYCYETEDDKRALLHWVGVAVQMWKTKASNNKRSFTASYTEPLLYRSVNQRPHGAIHWIFARFQFLLAQHLTRTAKLTDSGIPKLLRARSSLDKIPTATRGEILVLL